MKVKFSSSFKKIVKKSCPNAQYARDFFFCTFHLRGAAVGVPAKSENPWVRFRIPAQEVNVQLTQLFIFPSKLVNKWGILRRVNCGDPDLIIPLCPQVMFFFPITGSRANIKDMCIEPSAASVCPQLDLYNHACSPLMTCTSIKETVEPNKGKT